MSNSLVYVTVPTREEALKIGRTVVAERWAACANVLAGITSFYWWEQSLQEDAESVLILKTRSDLVAALTERIKELHSYACPCVVALPIHGGNAAFLDWIGGETRSVL